MSTGGLLGGERIADVLQQDHGLFLRREIRFLGGHVGIVALDLGHGLLRHVTQLVDRYDDAEVHSECDEQEVEERVEHGAERDHRVLPAQLVMVQLRSC